MATAIKAIPTLKDKEAREFLRHAVFIPFALSPPSATGSLAAEMRRRVQR